VVADEETRRTGGGAKVFFCVKAGGVTIGGGTALLFAVEFLNDENMFLAEEVSTSPNLRMELNGTAGRPADDGSSLLTLLFRLGGAGGGAGLPFELSRFPDNAKEAAATLPMALLT